jgi:hypothetical protein
MQTRAIGLNHRTTRQHRPWAVWFALCIATVMALAPTLSHALAWSQGSGGRYMEICTATGTRLVPVDSATVSADSPAGQESVLSLSHCPFCLHATHSLALPPYVSLPAFAGLGEPVVPALGLATLHITQPVCVPPPRGPPASL